MIDIGNLMTEMLDAHIHHQAVPGAVRMAAHLPVGRRIAGTDQAETGIIGIPPCTPVVFAVQCRRIGIVMIGNQNDRTATFALGRTVGLLRPVITKCLLGIEIRIMRKSKMLYITIANSIEEFPLVQEGKLITGKKEKQRHGYGLKSVQHVVRKYRGDFEYQICEKEFIVTIKFWKL